MLEPLVKLGNYLQQHQSGIDVRWTMKVIEEARQQQTEHLEHVEAFLQEMYATMIDPVEQPKMTVTEMCALLLKTAQQQREQAYAASRSGAEERRWSTADLPQEESILAEIEYNFSGHPITERIICIVKGEELETEAGDDVGWTSEVITRWMRLADLAGGNKDG